MAFKFRLPRCDIHPNSASDFITLEEPFQRLCHRCLRDGKQGVPNQEFLEDKLNAIYQLFEHEGQALDRRKQLESMEERLKREFGKEDNEVLKRMLEVIAGESKAHFECQLRIQELKNRLRAAHRTIKYFRTLRDQNLLTAKLNLSSELGIRRFHQRSQEHTGLISQLAELEGVERRLADEEATLGQLESGSVVAKLKAILVERNLITLSISGRRWEPPKN